MQVTYDVSACNESVQICDKDKILPLKSIDQLGTNIYNSQIRVKVLKKFYSRSSDNNGFQKEDYMLLVARDDKNSIKIFCTGDEIISQCNRISVGDVIFVRFADVRLKKFSKIFTTSSFDLYLESNSIENGNSPLIFRVPHEFSYLDDSFPLYGDCKFTDCFSIISGKIKINSICNLFVLISYIGGPSYFRSGVMTRHRILKCIDDSIDFGANNGKELVISVWNDECSMFEPVNEGQVVVIERVKITQYKDQYQVTTIWNTLLHGNIKNERAAFIKDLWKNRISKFNPSAKMKLITDYFTLRSSNSNADTNKIDTNVVNSNSNINSNTDTEIFDTNRNIIVHEGGDAICLKMKNVERRPSGSEYGCTNLKRRKNMSHISRINGNPIPFALDYRSGQYNDENKSGEGRSEFLCEEMEKQAMTIKSKSENKKSVCVNNGIILKLEDVLKIDVNENIKCIALISKIMPKVDNHGYCIQICSKCLKVQCNDRFHWDSLVWKYVTKVSVIDETFSIEEVLVKDSDMEVLIGVSAWDFEQMEMETKMEMVKKLEWQRYDMIITKLSEKNFALLSIKSCDFKFEREE